ncbi:hypothetical protein M011DRAFT_78176 [Sporormia fimetaria CBS 119925]|uniref:Uncharacterized protein n=1 Tax=Sporormia fimetaria CBS 119925 TaxID=1340428 RepID=A0A6A6V7X4_9PLEO|nr:hypothetical protein M011DRAFT_78176 [Sporormia fimetaria CBS 119925]
MPEHHRTVREAQHAHSIPQSHCPVPEPSQKAREPRPAQQNTDSDALGGTTHVTSPNLYNEHNPHPRDIPVNKAGLDALSRPHYHLSNYYREPGSRQTICHSDRTVILKRTRVLAQ